MAKRLKLKVRKVWGLILTFVEVTGEKLVGDLFWSPPILNRVNYPLTVEIYLSGWGKKEQTKFFIPLLVVADTSLVPEKIMNVFICGCVSENSCKLEICSCNKLCLPSFAFCECGRGTSYMNPFNAKARKKKGDEEHVINSFPLKYIF